MMMAGREQVDSLACRLTTSRHKNFNDSTIVTWSQVQFPELLTRLHVIMVMVATKGVARSSLQGRRHELR